MKFDRATDASIRFLVRAFYEKVRGDPQLAPVFTEAIGERWDAHISRMCDFWGAALRISTRYKGDMLAAHRRVRGLGPALFERWLSLFEQTVAEHFAGAAGAAVRDRAQKTARNLELALFHRANEAPTPARPGMSGVAAAPALCGDNQPRSGQ